TSTLVNTPSEQTSCHTPSAASGPTTRLASRGTRTPPRRRRCGAGRVSASGAAARETTAVPARAVPPRTVPPSTLSAMLRYLLDHGVVVMRCGRAEERRDAVGLGEGARAGHEVDHGLERALDGGPERHVDLGAAGGEDQL